MKLAFRFAAAALAAALALAAMPEPAGAATAPPTVEEAQRFLAEAEARLLELWIERDRAQWVQSTYITDDTEILAAAANERAIAAAMLFAQRATRFDGLALPAETARKLALLKVALTLPAPTDAKESAELARIAAELEGLYGKGQYCPGAGRPCLDLDQLSEILATWRDPQALAENPERLLGEWKFLLQEIQQFFIAQ